LLKTLPSSDEKKMDRKNLLTLMYPYLEKPGFVSSSHDSKPMVEKLPYQEDPKVMMKGDQIPC
jgi:hypothetical protein